MGATNSHPILLVRGDFDKSVQHIRTSSDGGATREVFCCFQNFAMRNSFSKLAVICFGDLQTLL